METITKAEFVNKALSILLVMGMFISMAGFLFFSDFTPHARAGTVNAATCSQADVTAAISSANSGDTVLVPAGTCTWSSSVSITKAISIIGATTGCPESCDDATTINIGTGTAFNAGTVGDFRISGFTFSGPSNSSGVVFVNRSGVALTDWRIDHNHFKDVTGRGISVGAYASASGYLPDWPALIDNNRFAAPARFKAIQTYGGSVTTHGSWDEPLELGGSDFLFIENNHFVHSTMSEGVSSIDSDTGGRYVVRHNKFVNGDISAHGVEISVGPLWRSTHGFEIYGNEFTSTVSHQFQINIRGGTGVIYDNSFDGTQTGFKPVRYLYERGDYDASGRGFFNAPSPCNGQSQYDGNQSGAYGYVCYQQIGATGSNGIISMPVYQWGNSYNGVADESVLTEVTFSSATVPYQHVQIGRDVILNGATPKPGYTAYTFPHPLTGESGNTPTPPPPPPPGPNPPPPVSPQPNPSPSPSSGGSGGGSSGPQPTPTPSTSTSLAFANIKLVTEGQTYYVIKDNQRYGVTNPGILFSYGLEFKDGRPQTAAENALPYVSTLKPGDGALVKKPGDTTVFLIFDNQKHGFTSETVFNQLGYSFSNVLEVTANELDALTLGNPLNNSNMAHPNGTFINQDGTIFRIHNNQRYGIPSMEVYNSYCHDNSFNHVVPANSYDRNLPAGSVLEKRTIDI